VGLNVETQNIASPSVIQLYLFDRDAKYCVSMVILTR